MLRPQLVICSLYVLLGMQSRVKNLVSVTQDRHAVLYAVSNNSCLCITPKSRQYN